MPACNNQNHPKFHSGDIEICYVCHWRTDGSFAFWSRELLKRIKEKDQQLEEAA